MTTATRSSRAPPPPPPHFRAIVVLEERMMQQQPFSLSFLLQVIMYNNSCLGGVVPCSFLTNLPQKVGAPSHCHVKKKIGERPDA